MKVQIVRVNPIIYNQSKQKTIFDPNSNTNSNTQQKLPPTVPKDSINTQCIYPLTIIKTDGISFGYKSVLKTEWLKGNMPSVKLGLYGGELTKKNVTLEHILPHSKGGKTELPNLALAVNVNNWSRSNKPFKDYFDPEAINEYLEQFKEVDLPNFNGLKYIDGVTKVIKRILRNEEYDFSNIPFLK